MIELRSWMVALEPRLLSETVAETSGLAWAAAHWRHPPTLQLSALMRLQLFILCEATAWKPSRFKSRNELGHGDQHGVLARGVLPNVTLEGVGLVRHEELKISPFEELVDLLDVIVLAEATQEVIHVDRDYGVDVSTLVVVNEDHLVELESDVVG